jgi:hypothetical protein
LPTIGKDSVPHPTDEAHGAHRRRGASSKTVREVVAVLSSQEQRIWDDVQRFWAEDGEEPPRAPLSTMTASSRDQAELPLAVVGGIWITVTLVLFAAITAALTVGVATALAWVLWHNWPQLSRRCARGRGGPPARR